MGIRLLITFQAGWPSEKAAPQFTFSKNGSDHSRRISLFLIGTFAHCSIALSFSTSLQSQKVYHSCIQQVTANVLHPYKTLLRAWPDVWLLLFVKFIPCRNHAFFLDTDPVVSLRGTRIRANTTKWDITAQQTVGCLVPEFKPSVDKSGCLVDAEQIVS